MTTLPSMSLVLPTRGPSGSGHWADVLDANLALLDSHSHGPGSGVRITPTAININADLSFNTSWAITALNRATFAAVAPPAVNKSIFVGDGTGGTTANELYWTNNVGTNVKLTSGNTLNVASFVGGIVDDYASVGAQLGYDNGAKRYTFKQGTADSFKWAKLQAGSLRLVEYNTTETVFVEQLCPAALAVTYSMTWPLALPASTVVTQIDSTGQWVFDTAIVNDLTMTANKHVTVSGTGEYKHGNRTLVVAAASGFLTSGTFAFDGTGGVSSTASGNWFIPVQLHTGDRVQSCTIARSGDGAVDAVLDVLYISATAGSTNKATATITNAPVPFADSTATAGSPAALAAGEICLIHVTPNASGFVFNNIRIVYDRP